jgi:DNA-binding CsgD family transcriptional regulator
MTQNNKPIITIPPALLQLLLNRYPNLSPVELKVSALLSFNLASSSVAEITGRSIRTIEYTRSNIRKKMKLQPDENLVNHLIMLSSLPDG